MQRESISVYCDESSHLLNDHLKAMALGSVWTPKWNVQVSSQRIRDIKEKHGLPGYLEMKWNKVSPAQLQFYLDVVDYFFDDDDLSFRVLVIPDKTKLRHEMYDQDHDTWYYKMYFLLLRNIIKTDSQYSIYLDIKDSHGGPKVESLSQVLANSQYDFSRNIVRRLQVIRSEESQIMQLCDLLLGAVASVHRDRTTSAAKLALIERIRERSGRNLLLSSLPSEDKFNVFVWRAAEW